MPANDFQEKIYCHIQNQLNAIAIILEAVEQHSDSDWDNILVKPDTYISTVLLRMLNNISENTYTMRMMKQNNPFKWICYVGIPALFFARKML